MMMFMGRSGRNGRGSGNGVQYDPYQCAATCAAQQGYCPKVPAMLQLEETAMLQLEEMPLPARVSAGKPSAAMVPTTPLMPASPAMMPLAPQPPLVPASPLAPNGDALGMVYPMLMMMGAKKHNLGGMGASPMLAGCTQTCQAQLGCGELPDGD